MEDRRRLLAWTRKPKAPEFFAKNPRKKKRFLSSSPSFAKLFIWPYIYALLVDATQYRADHRVLWWLYRATFFAFCFFQISDTQAFIMYHSPRCCRPSLYVVQGYIRDPIMSCEVLLNYMRKLQDTNARRRFGENFSLLSNESLWWAMRICMRARAL